jgi:hypothetical protein
MAEKLFFSQDIITSWTDDQRVQFENETLSINTGKGKQDYKLAPAYRVIKISDGGPDPNNLVNTIQTSEELQKLGADVYMSSGIIGEIAYDLEPGYVATKAEDERSIEELLMEYLAKTLI